MTINQNFQDKIALITGGASGIGLATAKKLSQYGAIIIIADQNIDNKEKAMNALQTNDNLFLQVDVSKPESVTNMIKEIINKYNRIDILIHSAGIGVEKLFLETTTNEWNKILNLNINK